MFNERKFRATIVEHYGTLSSTAMVLGISDVTLRRKMEGVSDFTRNEIQQFRLHYGLTAEEVDAIFFAPDITETQGGKR